MDEAKSPAVKYFLFLGFLVFLVFGVGLKAPLIYDDIARVQRNPLVTGSWPGITAWLFDVYGPLVEYEPLVDLTHWAIYRIPAIALPLCRLSSLLLHWLNACLILLIYRRLLKDEPLALGAALLFAFYPSHTEVLAIASFKKHLLVAFCGLLILDVQARRPGRPWAAALCGLLQLLALLAKESALAIPAFALLAAHAGRQPWKANKLAQGVLIGVCLCFAAFRLVLLPRQYPAPLNGDWAAHFLTSLKCLFWSLAQFPIPWDLCLEHTLAPVRSLFTAEAAALSVGLVLLGTALAWLYRKDRVAAFGLAWSLLFLAPFINLLPFLNFSLVANRYLYLASAGFFLLSARLLQKFPPGKKRAAAAFAALFLAYGIADVKSLALFTDPLALWTRTARCAPENPRAHAALAIALASQKMHAQALPEYRRALELSPGLSIAAMGQADAYAQMGRIDEAIAMAEAAIKRFPEAGHYANLGVFQMRAGNPRKSVEALEKAAAMDPGSHDIRLNLGVAYLALGQAEPAEEHLIAAAQTPETRARAFRFLGEVYARKNRPELAASLYEKSLSLNPSQIDATLALAKLYSAHDRRKTVALLDGYLTRLDRSLRAAKDAARAQDRAIIQETEREYAAARRERDELAR